MQVLALLAGVLTLIPFSLAHLNPLIVDYLKDSLPLNEFSSIAFANTKDDMVEKISNGLALPYLVLNDLKGTG